MSAKGQAEQFAADVARLTSSFEAVQAEVVELRAKVAKLEAELAKVKRPKESQV